MGTKHLVLQRDEPFVFGGTTFEGVFGNKEQAARLRNKLEQMSQNHKIHVGTMETHEELPFHIRELIGTWHRGEVLRPKSQKREQKPAPGFGHKYNMPKP